MNSFLMNQAAEDAFYQLRTAEHQALNFGAVFFLIADRRQERLSRWF